MPHESFEGFFKRATGYKPLPWQTRLATEGELPEVVDVPTGLGKTAGVTLAWLWRRRQGEAVPRRLIWCLPMRALVEQTADEVERWGAALGADDATGVYRLLGGEVDEDWILQPEEQAVLVGTQDMLLSRALMRGYAMKRYAWPLAFAWLHNDALWVYDEVQLMGPGLPTSLQLDGLRGALGTSAPSQSLWVSATVRPDQLSTIDRPAPARVFRLTQEEASQGIAAERVSAPKVLERATVTLGTSKAERSAYPAALAEAVLAEHTAGTFSLVVLNRVQRAQAVHAAFLAAGRSPETTLLLHSRFRARDRAAIFARMLAAEKAKEDLVVVATQVVEAGMDLDARALWTELAPWPSIVQRAGRCNRRGTRPDARVSWIPLDPDDNESALPYTAEALTEARAALETLTSASPGDLGSVPWTAPPDEYHVLRRQDLLELFDTTQDLSGFDIDISRFIRDADETDVFVAWRALTEVPGADTPQPERDELCRVSITQARKWVEKTQKKLRAPKHKERDIWAFDPLESTWSAVKHQALRPGMILLAHADAGGYTPEAGFTGEASAPVPEIPAAHAPAEGYGADPLTHQSKKWTTLAEHTDNVAGVARDIARDLALAPPERDWLEVAARWHDLGKAHPQFQDAILDPGATGERRREPDVVWAKSDHNLRPARSYRAFRHELASALAWLQHQDADTPDRWPVAWMIAAHHGKVRVSLRALPTDKEPPADETTGAVPPHARGIWHGDELAPHLDTIHLGGGVHVRPAPLDLSVTEMGEASWRNAIQRMLENSAWGPFRLAWLEALLRAADQRASAEERKEASHD